MLLGWIRRGIATPINKSTRKQPPLGSCGVYATHALRTLLPFPFSLTLFLYSTPLFSPSTESMFSLSIRTSLVSLWFNDVGLCTRKNHQGETYSRLYLLGAARCVYGYRLLAGK